MKQTIVAAITDAISGHRYLTTDPLAAYHAANGVKKASLRVGKERRVAAAKKALKQFAVDVTHDEYGELELRDKKGELIFSYRNHKYDLG